MKIRMALTIALVALLAGSKAEATNLCVKVRSDGTIRQGGPLKLRDVCKSSSELPLPLSVELVLPNPALATSALATPAVKDLAPLDQTIVGKLTIINQDAL